MKRAPENLVKKFDFYHPWSDVIIRAQIHCSHHDAQHEIHDNPHPVDARVYGTVMGEFKKNIQ